VPSRSGWSSRRWGWRGCGPRCGATCRLGRQVDAEPGWERLAPVPLQTVCLRHRPPGLEGAALDAHNLALARAVNVTGRAYLTPAVVKGSQLIRVSIGAAATTQEDVQAVWDLLRSAARTLSIG